LPYYVRKMRYEDVPQVTEIDREAFPTQWPQPNYRREMGNRLSHYYVVCDEGRPVQQTENNEPSNKDSTGLLSRLGQVFKTGHFSGDAAPSHLTSHHIVGFVGFWIMSDEAHITSIAVREECRQRGIGEMLMTSVIERAMELKARLVTLEVRISNTAAQNLYTKYGFAKVGVRKGYYTDNREDALMMSTDHINTSEFNAQLQHLKKANSKKMGISLS
jgi:ribosomal-protein-alanine N-acetyltransferase